MPILIDGHNLIGQLPDIQLTDPDDEVQLVLKLRQYAGRFQKKVIVVFDNGLPAGLEKGLSTHSVEVRFASAASSADNSIRHIILSTKNPSGWMVVSSDTQITQLAAQCGMKCTSAHQFASTLTSTFSPSPKRKKQRQTLSKKIDPHLSKAEIDEWLNLFSPEDE